MPSFAGLLRAPATSWVVTMKPSGHSKKAQERGPEVFTVSAHTKSEAIQAARNKALLNGFSGYAITDIKEVKQ